MAASKTILALDIAAQTGFAFGKPGEAPTSGTLRLQGEGLDERAHFLVCWMTKLVREHGIDVFYVELPMNPFHMKGKTTFSTILSLIVYWGVSRVTAYGLGIRYRLNVHPQDVRKWFLGVARPKTKKLAVMAKCREMGWKPRDDNEADALAIWQFACGQEAPEESILSTPLFAENRDIAPLEDEEAPF